MGPRAGLGGLEKIKVPLPMLEFCIQSLAPYFMLSHIRHVSDKHNTYFLVLKYLLLAAFTWGLALQITHPVAYSLNRLRHAGTSTYLLFIYRVSQEEWTKLRESVPYVELYRYNPKHLYPKLNGYGDNGQRSLKF